MTTPIIDNKTARRIFLHHHGLSEKPNGPSKGADLLDVITRLGFVQIDSISMVQRAHHMILHARRQSYRAKNLTRLLETDRTLFEHWTHDASVIPTEFYRHWQLRFQRDATMLRKRWKNWHSDEFVSQLDAVKSHIRDNGCAGTGDVGKGEKRSSGGWWEWNPSKTALEFLWRTGQLSVTRRESFRKIYDLTERVFEPDLLADIPSQDETIDWCCNAALDRLGFATSGELAAFWDHIKIAEARDWCKTAFENGTIVEVDIACTDGTLRRSFMRPAVLERTDWPKPPSLVRILSPFDPALRDRDRAHRLFNFFYRIEIYVPAPKRQYGYYVYPVMEGANMIGRIDMKCDRPNDRMLVTAFWPEKGIKLGDARVKRIVSAIERTTRFAGHSDVIYEPDWLRETLLTV